MWLQVTSRGGDVLAEGSDVQDPSCVFRRYDLFVALDDVDGRLGGESCGSLVPRPQLRSSRLRNAGMFGILLGYQMKYWGFSTDPSHVHVQSCTSIHLMCVYSHGHIRHMVLLLPSSVILRWLDGQLTMMGILWITLDRNSSSHLCHVIGCILVCGMPGTLLSPPVSRAVVVCKSGLKLISGTPDGYSCLWVSVSLRPFWFNVPWALCLLLKEITGVMKNTQKKWLAQCVEALTPGPTFPCCALPWMICDCNFMMLWNL